MTSSIIYRLKRGWRKFEGYLLQKDLKTLAKSLSYLLGITVLFFVITFIFSMLLGLVLMFTPEGWNNAYSGEIVLGLMPTGTLMMILWYVSTGFALVGIVVAFFRPRIAGIFILLAGIADGLLAVTWYLGVSVDSDYAGLTVFPIPISALFFLVTAIIAFTSKKKESYYF